MIRRSRKLFFGGLVFLALFLIAYPNPIRFFQTVQRWIHFPIDSQAVRPVSSSLPPDPREIEAWVLKSIAYDINEYANWGVAFYLATPAETLSIRRGLCYNRALVLASILEEKGIPYRVYATLGHVWVDYPGRVPRLAREVPEIAFIRWENGSWHYQGMGWLSLIPEAMLSFTVQFWEILPFPGKVLLALLAFGLAAARIFTRSIRIRGQRRIS